MIAGNRLRLVEGDVTTVAVVLRTASRPISRMSR